jgi:ankyrin repeat protein
MDEQDIFGWIPLHYCCACPKSQRSNADSLIWSICRNAPFINAQHHPDRMGRTPLHIAAARGFPGALSGMTSRLTPGEARSILVLKGQDGMTLMHLAVLSQSQNCLDLVMRIGYSLQMTNETDAWGREPMHIAAQIGNKKAVSKIVGRGPWSLSNDSIGNTPIDYLVEKNNERNVAEKQSIEDEKVLKDVRNSDDLAEKILADDEVDEEKKDTQAADEELKADQAADEDAQDDHDIPGQGNTEGTGVGDDWGLYSGSESSEADDTDTHKPNGGDPKHAILLELARLRPKWTSDQGKGFAHYMAEMGNLDLMSQFIANTPSVDMNMPDDNGMTPLHYAVSSGETNTAIALLEQFGANPLTEDKEKVTPFMCAVGGALLDVVQMLLKSYTRDKIDSQSARGESAVHYIVSTGFRKETNNDQRVEVLKMLRAAGFNILQAGQAQKTILNDALYWKDEPVLTYLLSLPREDLKDIHKGGDSPLVTACRHGLTAAVPVFLDMWPEMLDDVDDIWNRSALIWSCVGGHETIVRMLVAHSRTNLNYPFQSGYDHSPIHVATNRKSSAMLSCFLEQDPARYASSMTDIDITPLNWAIRQGRVQTARLWFDHPHTPDAHKIEGLRGLFTTKVKTAYKFRITIAHLFHAIPESAISEKDLLSLIEGARALRLWDALDAFVQRAMGSDAWTRIRFPYHVGIETSNTKLLASAIRKSLRYEDNDGWSLQTYAASFNRVDLLSGLDFSSVPAKLPSAEHKPARLRWQMGGSRHYRRLTPCRAHGKTICPGVQGT